MTILIEEPLKSFLEKSLPKLEKIPERHRFVCNKCKNPIEIPIIVKREDLESFKYLLKIAEIYLREKGGVEKMLSDMETILNNKLKIN